jgi:hypothetical protein
MFAFAEGDVATDLLVAAIERDNEHPQVFA